MSFVINQETEPTAEAIEAYLARRRPAWRLVRKESLFLPTERANGYRNVEVTDGERTVTVWVEYTDKQGIRNMRDPNKARSQ